MTGDPIVELDAGFSAEDGRAKPWATALELLEKAEVFWLSTVRVDGRPHVTPLVGVWLDGALYFCTGEGEQKERNIQRNPHCILTTGCNNFREGLDLVIEGDAVQVGDESQLHRLAGLWKSKYDWPYDVRDGVFVTQEARARCRCSRWLPPRPSHTTEAAMTARPATGFASVVTSGRPHRWFHTLAASSAGGDSTGQVGLDRPSAGLGL
jgi:general stress protein 26